MTFYELAFLGVPMRSSLAAAEAIAAFAASDQSGGELLGLWTSDIGTLNRVAVFRRFASAAALAGDRERLLASASPFGCGSLLMDLSLDAYAPFLDLPPVPTGALGPVYEIRTYDLRIGGLVQLQNAWRNKLPARTELSRLVAAMHSLDGTPRFTHIWPYSGLDERARVRAAAVRGGQWPPNAFPGTLPTTMRNGIYLPLPGSPLH